MTDFDDQQHPRHRTGKFSLKDQTAPETALGVDLPVHVSAADLAAADELTDADVYRQVSFRLGEREIDDAVAAAGARLIEKKFPENSMQNFASLGASGSFDGEGLSREIGENYYSLSPRDKDLVSMIGTWALDKNRS